MIEAALIAASTLALLAVVAFIAQYGLVRWERTQEGQNAMATSLVVLSMVAVGFVNRFEPTHELVTVAVYLACAAVFVWRSLLLLRAQRERRHKPYQPPLFDDHPKE